MNVVNSNTTFYFSVSPEGSKPRLIETIEDDNSSHTLLNGMTIVLGSGIFTVEEGIFTVEEVIFFPVLRRKIIFIKQTDLILQERNHLIDWINAAVNAINEVKY